MLPVVDTKSPKTQEFLKLVLNELINGKPVLETGAFEIKFVEDSPMFPIFTEAPIKGASVDELIPESFRENGKIFLYMQAIKRYWYETMLGACDINCVNWDEKYPMTISFLVNITKPDLLHSIVKKFGIHKTYDLAIGRNKLLIQNKALPLIYYDPNSGLGCINGRQFKFKNDQPEFKIFAKLYQNIGTQVSRHSVLESAGYEECKDLTAQFSLKNKSLKCIGHKYATQIINGLVKKIRKMSGLTPKLLVLNEGSLTLRGQFYETPPI